MQYAGGAHDSVDQPCLPGTRSSVMKEIVDWVDQPNTNDVPRVFWLNGVPGSGKSAIALAIRDHFASIKRLGSAFFFDKSYADRTPSKLFSTISRDIADLVPEWRTALLATLRSSRAIRSTLSVDAQWEQFIIKPAHELARSRLAARRIVIVIDAPDESTAGSTEREQLLSKFALLDQLPSFFRIFIASRPDHDIQCAFRHSSFVREKKMGAINEASTRDDIKLYARFHVGHSNLLPPVLEKLVDRADGYFQWMATACRYIRGKAPASEYCHSQVWLPRDDWKRRLSVVLTVPTTHLDGLYVAILRDAFGNSSNNYTLAQNVRSILGQIIYLKRPLPIAYLRALRGGDANDVCGLLTPLTSLFQGVLKTTTFLSVHFITPSGTSSPTKRGAQNFMSFQKPLITLSLLRYALKHLERSASTFVI